MVSLRSCQVVTNLGKSRRGSKLVVVVVFVVVLAASGEFQVSNVFQQVNYDNLQLPPRRV